MSKVSMGRGFSGQTPRSRGGFFVRDNDGKFVCQKWPRKRGKAKTPYDHYKQQEFALAGRMASNAISEDIFTATEMVKGTQQVPRDFLTMCIFGTAYQLVEEDGFVWPTFREMSVNPQYVLDLITTMQGSVLYRADIGWIGLDPGNAGQVLTMVDGSPVWRPPPVLPAAETKVTTLKRTTNQALVSSTNHIVTWQAAEIDELGIWDPANPTRVNIPAGATRLRVSTQLQWTALAATQTYNVELRANTGAVNWFGAIRDQLQRTNTLSSQRRIASVGPWCNAPAFSYFEVQYQQSSFENTGPEAGSSVTIEVLF